VLQPAEQLLHLVEDLVLVVLLAVLVALAVERLLKELLVFPETELLGKETLVVLVSMQIHIHLAAAAAQAVLVAQGRERFLVAVV
jgi:hypothetical protein